MNQSNTLAFIALGVGIVLIFFAWQASNAPIEQMSEALTGRYTSNTMLYLIGGLIGVLAGGALIFRNYASR